MKKIPIDILIIFLLTIMAVIRPNVSNILFYPWIGGVVLLYRVLWLRSAFSIISMIVMLLFAPICIALSIIGYNTAQDISEGLLQFIFINLVYIVIWCFVGLFANEDKVKIAMLVIDTLVKTGLLVLASKYFLDQNANVNLFNQGIQAVNFIVLPLLLAVIWGKLFFELRSNVKEWPAEIYSLFSDDFRRLIDTLINLFTGKNDRK